MKSILSIFLICYFSMAALVPRMDFDRLQVIPDFIAHYLDHENSDEGTNLLAFIDLHYGDETEEPDDGHELPFQEHDCCISCHNPASFSSGVKGDIASNLPTADLRDNYIFHFTSEHTSGIWQPPRA